MGENEKETNETHSDIGVYYKALGFISMVAAVVMVFILILTEHKVAWEELLMFVGLIFMSIILIRPEKFDSAFKNLMDALPFTKYKKPD